jgi:hypothetical protein
MDKRLIASCSSSVRRIHTKRDWKGAKLRWMMRVLSNKTSAQIHLAQCNTWRLLKALEVEVVTMGLCDRSLAVLTCECSEPCIMAMHVVVKMI